MYILYYEHIKPEPTVQVVMGVEILKISQNKNDCYEMLYDLLKSKTDIFGNNIYNSVQDIEDRMLKDDHVDDMRGDYTYIVYKVRKV